MHKNAEKLADLIEKTPNAIFEIDNDGWVMVLPTVINGDGDERRNEITDSFELQWETDFYGRSSVYGAGIAEALVILLNRRGFNIKAESV